MLYSEGGMVTGPGWTDVHIRLPAYGLMSMLFVVLSLVSLAGLFRRRFARWLGRFTATGGSEQGALLTGWGALLLVWFLALGVTPALIQWLVVVMHGNTLSYAETFEEAFQGLFEEGVREFPKFKAGRKNSLRELAVQANEAFKRYLQLQGEQQFKAAARELQKLKDILQRLAMEDTNSGK